MRSRNPTDAVSGALGALAGAWLVFYCKLNILIPAVAGIALYTLFTTSRVRPRHFSVAIAVVGGHIAWFALAAAITGNTADVLLDIVVLTACAAWLWLRPSLTAAAVLALVEVASLVINAMALFSAPVGSATHRALLVHCLLRVGAIAALAAGNGRWRPRKAEEAQEPAPSE